MFNVQSMSIVYGNNYTYYISTNLFLFHKGLQLTGTTATLVDDFSLATITPVSVIAGNTATIEFSTVSDTVPESNEAFTVTITPVTTENIGDLNTVTVTIEDDDRKIIFFQILFLILFA